MSLAARKTADLCVYVDIKIRNRDTEHRSCKLSCAKLSGLQFQGTAKNRGVLGVVPEDGEEIDGSVQPSFVHSRFALFTKYKIN